MAVLLDKDAFEPSLKKVDVSFVLFIKKLGIDTVKLIPRERLPPGVSIKRE